MKNEYFMDQFENYDINAFKSKLQEIFINQKMNSDSIENATIIINQIAEFFYKDGYADGCNQCSAESNWV